MKRRVLLLAIVLLCTFINVHALAEEKAAPNGFGFVNEVSVALRKVPEGEVIIRLDKDACVWLTGEQRTENGETWYEVRAGVRKKGTFLTCYSGWMMAKFIDAGDAVWQNVRNVVADRDGMIVLKNDGSVLIAGKQVLSYDGYAYLHMRFWAKPYEPVRQVGAMSNPGYCVLEENGAFHHTNSKESAFDGENIRMMESGTGAMFGITEDWRLVNASGWKVENEPWMVPEVLKKAVYMTGNDEYLLVLTKDGKLYTCQCEDNALGTEPPDWEQWNELQAIETAWIFSGEYPERRPMIAYAGVRTDGSVMGHPAVVHDAVKGWTDMKEAEIGGRWVVGLKTDGSCISAGLEGEAALDVSGWTEVETIEVGNDFCVGLKKDGTLVFAGDFFHETE